MHSKFIFAIMSAVASAPLYAQQTPMATTPTAVPGMQDPEGMMAAYQAAQAASSQPGDLNLSCDELQAKFTEVINDPAINATIEAASAAAQSQTAAMQKSQAPVAASTAASAAASMAPGGQWAALGTAMAQAEAAKAGAGGRMQQNLALAQGAMDMMPKLMRGQRLVELAAAKQCGWAAGALPAGIMNAHSAPQSGQ